VELALGAVDRMIEQQPVVPVVPRVRVRPLERAVAVAPVLNVGGELLDVLEQDVGTASPSFARRGSVAYSPLFAGDNTCPSACPTAFVSSYAERN
jgi:hypothetical protein